MSLALWMLAVGGWGSICAVWFGLLIAQFIAKARGLLLEPLQLDARHDADLPSVAVVIPARNEAANIRECIATVLEQSYPRLRVIVIDDRSEDATAAIVDEIAQNDARLSSIYNRELPGGWMGKSHALWVATREVTDDWLLFIDADCRLDSAAVTTALVTAIERRVDLLSLWPRQTEGGFWEHLLIPLCAGIVALWYSSSETGEQHRRRPFANGQFLLIRRDVYEQIGGHRAVRSALIEDVVLAERVQHAGFACWSGSGRRLFSVRMYTSLREIISGWARIYVGALRSRMKLLVSIAWLLFGSMLPFAALPWVAASLLSGDPGHWQTTLIILTLLHLSLMFIVSWRFWGLGGCRRIYLAAYPISCVIVIWILARAFWVQQTGRRVSWRDTTYAISRDGGIE